MTTDNRPNSRRSPAWTRLVTKTVERAVTEAKIQAGLTCSRRFVDSSVMRNRVPVLAIAIIIAVYCVAPSNAAAHRPILPKTSHGEISTRVSATGRYALLFSEVSRRQQIVVSRGQLGGAAERPVTIGSALAHVFDPSIEVAPDGTTYVTFFDYFEKHRGRAELALATLKPGRRHAEVQRLGRYLGGSRGLDDVTMAVDASGRLALGFIRETRTKSSGLVAFRSSSGRFSARSLVVRTHGGGSLDFPLLEFDSSGSLTTVINQGSVECDAVALLAARSCKSTTSRVFAARVSNSGSVSQIQILVGGTGCSAEALSAQPDGSAMVATICDVDSRLSSLNFALSVGAGPMSVMRKVSQPGSLGDYNPSVEALPSGRFAFVWNHVVKEITNDGDFTDQLFGTFVSADGSSLPPLALSPAVAGSAVDGAGEFEPTLATARGGKPYLMAAIPSKKIYRAAHIRDDLTLGPTVAIAPAHSEDWEPGVAEDGRGLNRWSLYRGESGFFGVSEFQLPPD